MKERHGLIMVHTGDGKGKTTAALGLAIRAFGSGLKVLILQFIKGKMKSGELEALEVLKNFRATIEVRQLGLGFTSRGEHDSHVEAARTALETAQEEISSGAWDMIILDEINYAAKFGLLSAEDVLSLVKSKPPQMHLLFTGRDALPELIDAADLVTEMKLIKHPYQQGITAQSGIEY
ncbi:MAG: cob(I)yrinic acid a,c-diamide adenosyltransferase [Selenomonadaceae bacterium]|nr:cob(I)yrinic acid a,c-diamide adenosyltransferase [Selenomonadaceae bacterium]